MTDVQTDKIINAEIEIIGLKCQLNPKNPNEVERVILNTTKKDITLRPKIPKSTFQNGIEFTSIGGMKINEIAPKIKEIAENLTKNKSVKYKGDFNIMTKEFEDGNTAQYNYIPDLETLNKWELCQ